jgi:hypothetical protein
MIYKPILSNFSSSQFQATLRVKQEKKASSQSIIVLKSTVFYYYVSIILQKYYSSLKGEVLFEVAIFRLNNGTLLHVYNSSLETRISYEFRIGDQSIGVFEFTIDNPTSSKTVVLNKFTTFNFKLRILCDMNHRICPSCMIIEFSIVESDLLKHR